MIVKEDVFKNEEQIEVLEKLKPVIEYSLLQTNERNRDELRQHLYELVIKTLQKVNFAEPKGLFLK